MILIFFISQQTPDCRAANLASGVNVRDLGNAIVNREYETIRQLNRCRFYL